MRALRVLCVFPLLSALGGCVMGPDLRQPAPPASMGSAFVRADTAGPALSPSLAPWWRDIRDPVLDELEDRALRSSPSIEIATARVRQARAQARGARAAAAPLIGSGAAVGNGRRPQAFMGPDSQSVFLAGADALWEIDLFGERQRANEAAQAQLSAAQFGVADARLSLSAEVARRYVGFRAAQQRLELTRRSLADQERILELALQLERAGKISRIERGQAEQELEAARLAVASLEAERDAHADALAVLIGEAPGALDARLAPKGPLPLPPATITVGDPAAMLARRPDIRAAEQRLRAANARIGVAEAARMPRVTLVGVIGLGGATDGAVTSEDNLFSFAGPTLRWNLADFGRGRSAVDEAKAGRDEAEATYRAALLAALEDAEGALTRHGEARSALAMQTRAARSARTNAGLAGQAHQAGRTSAVQALAANRRALAADDAQAQAQARLTLSYITLQKALAMGWEDGSRTTG